MIQKTSTTKGEESKRRKPAPILAKDNNKPQTEKARSKSINAMTKSPTKDNLDLEYAKTTAKKNRRGKTSPASKKSSSHNAISPEERYRMIAEAAYYIAESHGFDSSRTMQDWLEAEQKIDISLFSSNRNPPIQSS